MSKTSNQPMWPIRKILPFSCALAVGDRDAEAVAERRDDSPRVDALGRADRGDDGRAVVVRREELEAHRLRARRGRRGRGGRGARTPPRGPRRAAGRARRRAPATSETAGVNGASSFAWRLARALPVEVEARRRRPRGRLERGRRDGARTRGRAGSSAPSASRRRRRRSPTRRSRAARRRGSRRRRRRRARRPPSRRRRAPGRRRRRRSRSPSASGRRPSHRARRARGARSSGSASRPTRALVHDVGAVRPRHPGPALAEVAGRERRAARSPGERQVRDGGLNRAGAGGGEQEDVVLRAADLAAAGRGSARRPRGSRGPRWWMTGSASAASTSGGTGVGPGVNR